MSDVDEAGPMRDDNLPPGAWHVPAAARMAPLPRKQRSWLARFLPSSYPKVLKMMSR